MQFRFPSMSNVDLMRQVLDDADDETSFSVSREGDVFLHNQPSLLFQRLTEEFGAFEVFE